MKRSFFQFSIFFLAFALAFRALSRNFPTESQLKRFEFTYKYCVMCEDRRISIRQVRGRIYIDICNYAYFVCICVLMCAVKTLLDHVQMIYAYKNESRYLFFLNPKST